MWCGDIARAMVLMNSVDTGREEYLDGTSDNLGPVVAKEHFCLMIHQENTACRICYDDAVWSQFEEGLGKQSLRCRG